MRRFQDWRSWDVAAGGHDATVPGSFRRPILGRRVANSGVDGFTPLRFVGNHTNPLRLREGFEE